MKSNYTIRYSNNWKGHGFKVLKVINNENLSIVELLWWHEDDDYKHCNAIGQWRQKR